LGVQAYDLVNKSVGKDLAVAIQSDLADLNNHKKLKAILR
jgi:hypothetical protein